MSRTPVVEHVLNLYTYNDWPDIGATAAGLGARTATIATHDDLDALRGILADLSTPLVLDVRLDPTHHLDF